MKRTTPDPKTGVRRCGTDRTEYRYSKSIIRQFPVLSRPRPGILGYRAPRTPRDTCAAIMSALNREARLARQTGVNTPPEVLEDISAWIARGCLP